VAVKTESTYIFDSMIDITAISTANLRFATTPSAKKLNPGDCDDDRRPEIANKLNPGDCDDDRRPEMAMWPPKPEILISLKL